MHSIRLGAAMAMYLEEFPVYVIMMTGRWSSDAFLRFIRKQVEQFSHNVSSRMLRFELHRHVTDYVPTISSRLDPRQRNHPDNKETRRNIGGNLSLQTRLPSLSSVRGATVLDVLVVEAHFADGRSGKGKSFYFE